MADWLSELLCPLPYLERIVKAHELLAASHAGLTVDERARAAYFIAHAHRQLDQPSDALAMCQVALDWPMPDNRRALLLECQAMSQYDLGRFAALADTLPALDGLAAADTVRAHVLGLRGCLASFDLHPAAFDYFHDAQTLFEQSGHEYGQAWVQRSAASLALKLGLVPDCLAWAERITFTSYQPAARLLQAEACLMAGDLAKAKALTDAVLAGQYGELQPDDLVRADYVQAVRLLSVDRLAEADGMLGKASDGLADLQRQDIDLCDAINRLRNRLRRGEVACR